MGRARPRSSFVLHECQDKSSGHYLNLMDIPKLTETVFEDHGSELDEDEDDTMDGIGADGSSVEEEFHGAGP